jgi:hypothetical protein
MHINAKQITLASTRKHKDLIKGIQMQGLQSPGNVNLLW